MGDRLRETVGTWETWKSKVVTPDIEKKSSRGGPILVI